jgi:hypothetical protein
MVINTPDDTDLPDSHRSKREAGLRWPGFSFSKDPAVERIPEREIVGAD